MFTKYHILTTDNNIQAPYKTKLVALNPRYDYLATVIINSKHELYIHKYTYQMVKNERLTHKPPLTDN
jgi:hypothetical protein